MRKEVEDLNFVVENICVVYKYRSLGQTVMRRDLTGALGLKIDD